MAGKQTAQAGKATAPVSGGRRPQQPARSAPAPAGESVTRDENYDLISVLYHALQGAETLSGYLNDARGADDEELATFFEETRDAYQEFATQAKQLLMSRLEANEEDEDEEDEDEEDEDE